MAARRRAAAAAQHELAAHELAIIFADRALLRPEAGIGKEGAHRPLPDVAEHLAGPALTAEKAALALLGRARPHRSGLVELVAAERIERGGGGLPFRLGREPRAGPAREGVGLVIGDVADRLGGIDRMHAVEAEAVPAFAGAPPVQRRLDAIGAHPVPAVGQPQARLAISALVDEA